jgi:hypothetical protein
MHVHIHIHTLQLKEQRKRCNKAKQKVAKNELYQNFLQRVHEEHSSHFETLESIMTREKTLNQTYKDLMESLRVATSKNESMRLKFQQYKKDKYNLELSLNNDIASYSKLLEVERQAASDAEQEIMNEEVKQMQRNREMTQIIMAVENLHSRCKKVLKGTIKVRCATPCDAKPFRVVVVGVVVVVVVCFVVKVGSATTCDAISCCA